MAVAVTNPLDTTHLEGKVGRSAARSGKITLVAQVTRFALQLVSTAVLARLLSPADFGLIAMAYAVTRLGETVREAGLSQATVQSERVSHDQVSTLFWMNTVLGVAIGGAVAASSPAVAWFYGESSLLPITVALATNFVWAGVGVQHGAILERQMRYGALAVRDVGSLVVGFAVGAAMAVANYGYWSLVAMACATAAAHAAIAAGLSGWTPGRPVRGSGVRGMMKFGAFLTGASALTYLRRNVDNVLIGSLFGATALGYYSKAYQLVMLPIQQANRPLSGVIIAALSRTQDRTNEYRRLYRHGVFAVSALALPIAGFAFVAAPEVVLLVLGEEWVESTRLFYCLAPAAFAGALNGVSSWPLVSQGLGRQHLTNQTISASIIVPSMLVGAWMGTSGVALGFSISYCFVVPLMIHRSFQETPVQWGDLLQGLRWPVIATLAASTCALATGWWVQDAANPLARFFVLGSVFLATFFVTLRPAPEFSALLKRAKPEAA